MCASLRDNLWLSFVGASPWRKRYAGVSGHPPADEQLADRARIRVEVEARGTKTAERQRRHGRLRARGVSNSGPGGH